MADMVEAIRRNVAMALGIVIVGLLFTLAMPSMRMHTGSPGPGLLQAESPVMAIVVVVICMAVGLVLACLVGRLVNAVVGLFALGAGVFVLANRSGSFATLAFGDGSAVMMVVEVLVWAVLVLGAALVVFRVAGPLDDVEPDPLDRHPHWLLSREAIVSAGAGALVLPVVWLIAQSSMKGQVLAAVILGSVAAGLGGRLLSPHVQPKLLYGSVCVFAAIGYVVGMAMTGMAVDEAYVNSAASPLLLPMPVDYAAGALLGVSMGLGWAKSFLQHEEVPQTSRA